MNILQRIRIGLGLGSNPPGPRFIISRDYQIRIPFPQYDPRRPFRILNYLETRGLLKAGMLRRPRPISLQRLQAVHDPAYVQSLQDPAAMEAVLGFRLEAETQDKFLAFQRLMCGGTLKAARIALKRHDIAVNLGGGMHHAARASGSGFCVFNDMALAINHVRELGHTFPILVIDLDLHDGDGTRDIFAEDPTVHTFSIHNKDLGQVAATASTSIALGAEVEDDTYLAAVQEHLPPVMAAVKPGLVFYLAGSDPCVHDRLGNWRITAEGMQRRDRLVLDLVRPAGGPVQVPTVILLAGGYGPTAWRHGAAFFSWLLAGESRLDIPLEMELPVDHYRRLARHMKHPGLLPREKTPAAQEGDSWGLTEADLGGAVPGASVGGHGAGLFLGLYSRHGLELLLEEAGLMIRLRERGLAGLNLELDLDDPMGHTLRITAGHREPVVVVEVKLRVVRKENAGGRNLLVVEWLLLQDTRPAGEENARPLLPGQKHRGMGLLRDMAAVLIVTTERLELDGLLFTPSHFHLARLARGQGRFPEAEDEARYLAIEKAVKGMRLQEASAAVTAGRVRDRISGETVAWRPRPMIIPVNSSLQEELHGDVFRKAVTQAARKLDYQIV
ncbi:MAG: histone deacetylase [Candidatus Krumholzibacteria bacterium]|nr:histone deacetylase [Candidatus Krumholzibacteria bacterium]